MGRSNNITKVICEHCLTEIKSYTDRIKEADLEKTTITYNDVFDVVDDITIKEWSSKVPSIKLYKNYNLSGDVTKYTYYIKCPICGNNIEAFHDFGLDITIYPKDFPDEISRDDIPQFASHSLYSTDDNVKIYVAELSEDDKKFYNL